MSKSWTLILAGTLTALVMTAAFIMGGSFARNGNANAEATISAGETIAPLAANNQAVPVADTGQQNMSQQFNELQAAYQRQLEQEAQRIREAYQKQLEIQLDALRKEYERQLQEQMNLTRQQYEQQLQELSATASSSGQEALSGQMSQDMYAQQLELLRQQYEQQIQALQAAWAQREQAYQAQLNEAVRRLQMANERIQALSQQTPATSPQGVQERSRYEAEHEQDDDHNEHNEYKEHEEYGDD